MGTFMDDGMERVADGVARLARTALEPWGGVDACLETCEAAIRAVTDVQLDAARMVGVEPARSALATWAGVIRDVGAASLSRARWILDA